MKKFSAVLTMGFLVSNFAHAIVVPNWERPISGTKLAPTGDTMTSHELRAFHLTINKRDGAKAVTSFTMTEDTGIRCITTPCPSSKKTVFMITNIKPSFHGESIRYEATEKLVNIRPNVRIAPRKLEVTETSMELVVPGGGGFMRRTYWEVQVDAFGKPLQTYTGKPKPIATIQTVP